MTIEEAEEEFKRYDGHFFHMGREGRYKEYKALGIPAETEEKWRQELIAEYFSQLFKDEGEQWFKFNRIFGIIKETKTKYNDNISLYLKKLEYAVKLDKHERVLIIEGMAKNCSFILWKTELGDEMNRIMEQLMAFTCTEEDNFNTLGGYNMPQRYNEAVADYRKRYEYFREAYGKGDAAENKFS